MSRRILWLAAATFVLACGPLAAQPATPTPEDISRWSEADRASFNAAFDKATHDSCVTAAQTRGVTADRAEQYCSCVVAQLQPLSVEDKIALKTNSTPIMAASAVCNQRPDPS